MIENLSIFSFPIAEYQALLDLAGVGPQERGCSHDFYWAPTVCQAFVQSSQDKAGTVIYFTEMRHLRPKRLK